MRNIYIPPYTMINMRKQIKENSAFKLMIKVEDKNMYGFDQEGNPIIGFKWKEVSEVNLGSMMNPNRDIKGFKFLPVRYEKDHDNKELNIRDYLKDMKRFGW
jgi:phage terminase large subunit